MKDWLRDLLLTLPLVRQIKERDEELAGLRATIQQLENTGSRLEQERSRLEQERSTLEHTLALQAENESPHLQALRAAAQRNSVDEQPWRHPFLTVGNIQRFREYSEQVWDFARERAERFPRRLKHAFVINVAQNMYNWALMATRAGVDVELFAHVWDNIVISQPEWEEYAGEFTDIYGGPAFREAHPELKPGVPTHRIPIEDGGFHAVFLEFCRGNRQPLLRLQAENPSIRHEAMVLYEHIAHYYKWARAISRYDVSYAAQNPLPSYLSGRPYSAFVVGADLQNECGRSDLWGRLMSLSFSAARFVMLSNPHPLAHCRRLGLVNSVYLPYPVDDTRYSPGRGEARAEWDTRYGAGVYVLSTTRLDGKVKGQDAGLLDTLVEVARAHPHLRFVFLAWGTDAEATRQRFAAAGMQNQFILLNPVGKKKLIDYYRSCDMVLDQFVYGYYGATALEAASVGKPVVMKLRLDHYAPLYAGDTMPAINATTPADIAEALLALAANPEMRTTAADRMRQWVLRTHGAEKTIPKLVALLQLTADGTPLPDGLVSPLMAPVTDEEAAYHASCFVEPAR